MQLKITQILKKENRQILACLNLNKNNANLKLINNYAIWWIQ